VHGTAVLAPGDLALLRLPTDALIRACRVATTHEHKEQEHSEQHARHVKRQILHELTSFFFALYAGTLSPVTVHPTRDLNHDVLR
jgi:hypothetical protein